VQERDSRTVRLDRDWQLCGIGMHASQASLQVPRHPICFRRLQSVCVPVMLTVGVQERLYHRALQGAPSATEICIIDEADHGVALRDVDRQCVYTWVFVTLVDARPVLGASVRPWLQEEKDLPAIYTDVPGLSLNLPRSHPPCRASACTACAARRQDMVLASWNQSQ
jgi:hypothetical protein